MTIDQLVSYLKLNIPNRESYENIIYMINHYSLNEKLDIKESEESIEAIGTSNTRNNYMNLVLKPGEINFVVSKYNGKNVEKIYIKYDNYKTSVIFKNVDIIINTKTNNIDYIDIKNKEKIYNNYELICSRELSKQIYTNINKEDTFEYSEINKIEANIAIRRDVNVTNQGQFINNYRICNNYHESYNSKNNNHINGYHDISSEEYINLLHHKEKTIKK